MKETLYEISVEGGGTIASGLQLWLAMRFIKMLLEEDVFPKQCIYICKMDNN